MGGGGKGGEAHGGPLCPQLSEPAHASSQGGCCKRAGKLKQTPRLGAATCVAACCHSKHQREPNACRPARAPMLCLLMRWQIITIIIFHVAL